MSKILSIDDSKAVHAYLNDCFSGSKIEVSHALSGEEGLKILSGPSKFDLILLDWEMPGLTGPEVLKEIMARQIQTPVVMLTSKNAVTEIADMLEKGAHDYIMKPFTPDIIISKVETILGVTVEKS